MINLRAPNLSFFFEENLEAQVLSTAPCQGPCFGKDLMSAMRTMKRRSINVEALFASHASRRHLKQLTLKSKPTMRWELFLWVMRARKRKRTWIPERRSVSCVGFIVYTLIHGPILNISVNVPAVHNTRTHINVHIHMGTNFYQGY